MINRELTLTPSEFMTGYLLGDYGKNHLVGNDPTTNLLRKVVVSTVNDGPRSVRIVMAPIRLTISKSAGNWVELLNIAESQVVNGEDISTVYTWMLEHHFERSLVDRRPVAGPVRNLFDFITEHLVRLEIAYNSGWERGSMH